MACAKYFAPMENALVPGGGLHYAWVLAGLQPGAATRGLKAVYSEKMPSSV